MAYVFNFLFQQQIIYGDFYSIGYVFYQLYQIFYAFASFDFVSSQLTIGIFLTVIEYPQDSDMHAWTTYLDSSETNPLVTIVLCHLSLCDVQPGLANSIPNSRWNSWLAGLIDGDGYFLLNKQGYASLEITMDARDLCVLELIQSVYGGSIHYRSGLNSYKYLQHTRDTLMRLINDINGHILNPVHLDQLQAITFFYYQ